MEVIRSLLTIQMGWFFQASNSHPPQLAPRPAPPAHGICIHFLPPRYWPHRIRCWSWQRCHRIGYPLISIDVCESVWKKATKKSKTQQITHSTTTKQAFEEVGINSISEVEIHWAMGRLDTHLARCFLLFVTLQVGPLKKHLFPPKINSIYSAYRRYKDVGNWEDQRQAASYKRLGRRIPIQAVKSHKLQESKPKPSEREPRNTRWKQTKHTEKQNQTRGQEKDKTSQGGHTKKALRSPTVNCLFSNTSKLQTGCVFLTERGDCSNRNRSTTMMS